jgi:secreted trypsin-like serine protease
MVPLHATYRRCPLSKSLFRCLVVLPAVAGTAAWGAGPAEAIANGQDAPTGAYPFAVRLTMTGLPAADGGTRDSSCSGALIAARWVITAGHCFHDRDGRRLNRPVARRTTATIGRTKVAGPGGHVLDVVAVVQSATADVALAELASAVTDVTPLRISAEPPTAGEVVRLAGFGLTSDDDPNSLAARLQTGQFTVDHVGRSLLETSGRRPHPDTSPCLHDSGGPYFREPAGRPPLLVAVVSSGPSCPHADDDLSARVDNISGWISGTVATGADQGGGGRRWLLPALVVAAVAASVALLARWQRVRSTPGRRASRGRRPARP